MSSDKVSKSLLISYFLILTQNIRVIQINTLHYGQLLQLVR